jgi:hypothetical protein
MLDDIDCQLIAGEKGTQEEIPHRLDLPGIANASLGPLVLLGPIGGPKENVPEAEHDPEVALVVRFVA